MVNFTKLKESAVSSPVSENRIADIMADLEDFVKKIILSKKNEH